MSDLETYGTADLNRVQSELDVPRAQPEWVSRYRILELLGTGGMGEVYKAEQRSPFQRIVALKLIKLGMDSREVVSRFNSERQALAWMDHPNVAKVLDAGADPLTGRPFFVMEYVRGEPITRFCDERKLTIKQRLELFIQVCEAVAHAHQKMIVHRDLKPSNILVSLDDADGVAATSHVKVIDFGVAKALVSRLTDGTLFTETGQMVGTPEYMSPEQARSEGAADLDTRSDIYSLGVILYELLAGALPFDSKTLRSSGLGGVERVIRELEPPRPSTRLSSIGEGADEIAARRQTQIRELTRQLRSELEWIPLKAIRKDRSKRYSTASEFAQDIRNYLDDQPLLAGPESRRYRLSKYIGRNKVPLAIAAAFAILLCGGTALYVRGIRAEQAKTLAALHKAKAANDVAEAVSRFQTDMLASADPANSLGAQVTVLQATLAAVKELDADRLKDQPLVEAAVRLTVGNTLRSLGSYKEALPNFERALALHRQYLPPGDIETAKSLTGLASGRRALGNFHDAEPLAREALEIRQKWLPAQHQDIAESLETLGGLLRDQRKFTEADLRLREALAIRRAALSPTDPLISTTLYLLTMLLKDQDKFVEAEPLIDEAVRICRASLPPEHPQLGRDLHFQAVIRYGLGKLDDAEKSAEESLRIRRKALPPGHSSLALNLHILACVRMDRGEFAAAIPLFQDAVQIDQNAFPEGHPQIARSLNGLGWALLKHGDIAEAEQPLTKAVTLLRGVTPADPELARALQNLSGLKRAQRDFPEATRYAKEALNAARQALLTDNPTIASCTENLVDCFITQRQFADAYLVCDQVLETYHNELSPDHPLVARVINARGNVLRGQDRHAEAEEAYRLAMKIQPLPTYTNNVAWELYALGKLDDAETLASETLDKCQTSVPARPLEAARSMTCLGFVYRSQGQLDRAEQKFRDALTIRQERLGLRAPATKASATDLCNVLVSLGRSTDADAIRQKYGLESPTTAPANADTEFQLED